MRWLEVRRHSMTKKGPARGRGSALSPAGVVLARRVGADIGSLAYVVTSESPRAVETAIAMGYAVDEVAEMPSGYVPGVVEHHEQWRWPRPYLRYAELLGREPALAAVADAHQRVWLRAVQAVSEGGAALLISHGGSIEPTLVACLPDADHGSWGAPLAHCEGVRLRFDHGRFTHPRFRRCPGPGHRTT